MRVDDGMPMTPTVAESLSPAPTAAIARSQTNSKLTSTTVGQQLPITLSGLSYTVGKKKTSFTILKSIDGCFEPGRMAALMGPSGCGKTTLMDVIAGRKTTGTISGQIQFGGAKCGRENLRYLCGYVEQFDNLVQELTVQEMFHYTAELKLPAFSKRARSDRVEECIVALNLTSCRSTLIGGPLIRGVSGGQKKRVNIGLSLITRPPIVFLDEPTSGLDSFMADEVCLLLTQLAKEGRTLVATIHSPTARSFALFDDLMLLNSGLAIYAGPSNDAVEKYLCTALSVPPLGVGESLPEWLIYLTSTTTTDVADTEAGANGAESTRLADLYRQSDAYAALQQRAKANGVDGGAPPITTQRNLRRANPVKAVWILLKYRAMKDYKSPIFLGPRIGDKLIFSLIIMSMYWGEGSSLNPQGIQSITGVLFMIVALCGYGAASVVPTLVLDRPLFYRELNDGCYGALSYFVYKILQEGLLCIFTSLLFIVVIFWAIGLNGNFGIVFFVYYLTTMISISLAYAVATIAPNMDAASALLPTYVTLAMFGGGLIMTISTMPPWWAWFNWTSFIRYAWAALMNNNFDNTLQGNLSFLISATGEPQNILQFYSITGDFLGSVWVCVGMLCVPLAVFLTCGGIVIKTVRHENR